MMNQQMHRNQDATIYVGHLDEQVTDALLYELFTQVGRVLRIHMPKDKVLNKHRGMAFIEFRTEADADYAQLIMNMVKLYDRPMKVSKSNLDGPDKSIDIGANLFIGNLSLEVDDKVLHDTFSAFGPLADNAHVGVDDNTGNSLSYGFVSYNTFEAADSAIHAMNGQYLCGRQINVQYAFKKDASKKGERERHGSAAERLLASTTTEHSQKRSFKPHTHFSTGSNNTPINNMRNIPQLGMGQMNHMGGHPMGGMGMQMGGMGMQMNGAPPPPPPLMGMNMMQPGMMMMQPGMQQLGMQQPRMLMGNPPPPPPNMMMMPSMPGMAGLPPPLLPPPPMMMMGAPPGIGGPSGLPPPLPPPPPPM